ncbi:alpha-L-rhamnosidase [Amycolatopsis bartoniae]|uniref:alpha-L-rhamnosidase n=1 Tax=Amycolatopsis bartoniae TaxID=941986 RepID=A0A8H9IR63_9PSEU|nr:family 78 glycoside hydrolase catalytic domain [Amycolatopsis bartoniae]MBB2939639.1 alpha-L-rhamnosidase [Amycolatopsis bartoniae]GHF39785.1 hypothetical protein GCM10017566_11410 [Amycolatopsis bartoniae]
MSGRHTAVLALAAALVLSLAAPAAATPGSLSARLLRAAGMTDPIGLEDTTPDLSWQFASQGRDAAQTAYEIRAASDPRRLGSPDLWDTGKVASSANTGVDYAGKPVAAGSRVTWQVRVWDERGRASAWSAPAFFEPGLRDWQAQWIGNPDWERAAAHPITVDLGSQTGRYVRIDVSFLEGATTDPAAADRQARLALAEIEVGTRTDPAVNLARGATVTTSESDPAAGEWDPGFLTDGQELSDQAPRGYRSPAHPGIDVTAHPIRLQLDLGAVRTFDQLRLYPRTDVTDQFARTADYPRDYQVSVATDSSFTTVKKVSRQAPPSALRSQPAALPRFVKDFALRGRVASARLFITGSGLYDAEVNGAAVSKAVLEPPNTDFREQVVASTYDVTSLLDNGRNRIAVELGPGDFDVHDTPDAPSRYQYVNNHYANPRLLAQLQVRYTDGRTETIATDGSWQTGLGATTFSNWYGGEDYDARRETPDWARAGAGTWQPVVVTGNPLPTAKIVGRTAPPVEPVDTLPVVAVTQPRPGEYVLDFGTNVAGWPQLRLDGAAGTRVELRPAEKLNADGTITQSGFRGPVWDSVTLAGKALTWHPRYTYHGFRYLEVTGLPAPPAASAIVLRTTNHAVGSFDSSDDLLDGIHRIIDRSVQSNMYSILTDCPHREKLGWLEQDSLVFGTVSRGYDVQAYYRKLLRDMADAQTPSGLVPDIAPEYTEFTEWDAGYRDDANWGGTLVLAPWLLYRTYADQGVLSTYYPNMRRYLSYLDGKASGGLLDGGLGDWIGIDTSTPRGYTATYGYLRLTRTMAQIADVLGEPADAAAYRQRAGEITKAFNAKYLDAANHTYASGNQTGDALALDLGVVPADQHDAVLAHLIANIRAKGNHLDVGEIGLPAVIDVLSAAGRDDVVYDIATQRTAPSYGAQVLSGSTSLGEAWDGLAGNASQNHFMLGAIDEWFTAGLGGIRQADGDVGYRHLEIAPAVVGTLTDVSASYRTPQGEVRTHWQRHGDSLRLDVTVPANTTARVVVPLSGEVREVGSGDWTFTAHA